MRRNSPLLSEENMENKDKKIVRIRIAVPSGIVEAADQKRESPSCVTPNVFVGEGELLPGWTVIRDYEIVV